MNTTLEYYTLYNVSIIINLKIKLIYELVKLYYKCCLNNTDTR